MLSKKLKDKSLSESAQKAVDKVAGLKRRELKAPKKKSRSIVKKSLDEAPVERQLSKLSTLLERSSSLQVTTMTKPTTCRQSETSTRRRWFGCLSSLVPGGHHATGG